LGIIKAVEKITGKEVPILFARKRDGDPAELVASNDFAREQLYWIPRYTNIEEIIE
jgi:UDP-glucose 4-epimerase